MQNTDADKMQMRRICAKGRGNLAKNMITIVFSIWINIDIYHDISLENAASLKSISIMSEETRLFSSRF